MGLFTENSCRLCVRVFCCVNCRLRHEQFDHNVNPDCDICVYGRMFISKVPNKSVMEHIKDVHLPVHCVRCGEIFETMDLITSCKCPAVANLSVITPVRLAVPIQDYESPPVSSPFNKEAQYLRPNGNFISVTTSTPVQIADNKDIDAIAEAATPCNENQENINTGHHNINEKKEAKRVTFGEPSIFESTRKSDVSYKCHVELSSILKTEKVENLTNHIADNTENAIQEKLEKEILEQTQNEDSVLWQSALNCEKDDKEMNMENKSAEANSNVFLISEVTFNKEEITNLSMDNLNNNSKETDSAESEESEPEDPVIINVKDTTDKENKAICISSKPSLWSSMANVVKKIYLSASSEMEKITLSNGNANNCLRDANVSLKRRRSNDEENSYPSYFEVEEKSWDTVEDTLDAPPQCKKIRLVDVQGRRAIRSRITTLCCHQCLITKKITFDKATQTDRKEIFVLNT